MASDPLLDATRALVERVAGPSRTPEDSGPETPLSAEGFWLDSVELLELVVACETEFNIMFDATTDLTGGTFETLGALTERIREKRSHDHTRP